MVPVVRIGSWTAARNKKKFDLSYINPTNSEALHGPTGASSFQKLTATIQLMSYTQL